MDEGKLMARISKAMRADMKALNEKLYHPKGGMCSACDKRLRNCSNLDFTAMRKHSAYGVNIVVICDQFIKGETIK